jgi:uncharacterized repeat protein (TIGR01451 family)
MYIEGQGSQILSEVIFKMAIFTNQAILSYRNGAVSSNVVTGEILETLSATKNSLIDTYSVGDTVTYVIGIFNSGASPVTGVTVTDDLGAYPFNGTALVPLTYVEGSLNYYQNGVLQPDPTVNSGGTGLTVTNVTVPANGYAQLIYQARVNNFAPIGVGGQITNTATVISCGERVTAQETVTANEAPLLGINKGVSPTTVTENGQLTYTFTIQNFGNAAAGAEDALSVTDVFDPILDPITVTYNGTVLTEGTEYTYDSATGLFTTTAGTITVPAATVVQDPATGEFNVTPGTAVLTVTGTVRG